MSTNDNNNTEVANNDVVSGEDFNLEDFSKDFFNSTDSTKEEVSVEKEVDTPDNEVDPEDDPLEEQEDDLEDTDDGEETDEEDSDEPDQEDKEKTPKKENRFQKRINDLIAQREAEKRERLALEERLKALEAKDTESKPQPKTETVEPDNGPQPNDKNQDGTDKYPLGEFDPSYIRDVARHAVAEERKLMQKQQEQEAYEKKMQAERQALDDNWNSKLVPAKQKYSDFDEKGQQLVPLLTNVDPSYGEYLGATLMAMDHGPEVMYYLANNLDIAADIIAKGPMQATIALGRIDAKFATDQEARKQARPKTSNAPTPPAHRNRGSAQSMPEVAADTDNLDDFSRILFKK